MWNGVECYGTKRNNECQEICWELRFVVYCCSCTIHEECSARSMCQRHGKVIKWHNSCGMWLFVPAPDNRLWQNTRDNFSLILLYRIECWQIKSQEVSYEIVVRQRFENEKQEVSWVEICAGCLLLTMQIRVQNKSRHWLRFQLNLLSTENKFVSS